MGRNHGILCVIFGPECFRAMEKQMFVNAPKIATLSDKCLSHLHHLSDLGFNIDETVLIRDAK